jgi:hypothetical protein
MPMASSVRRCELCAVERLSPIERDGRVQLRPYAWDGKSYPSRRRHRLCSPAPEVYEQFLAVVLGAAEFNAAIRSRGGG